MSRCFSYPPPGYVRNGASVGDTLIDSIKLQKEKAEIERKKERKRERKGKREEKEKRKEKHGDKSDGKEKRLGDKCHQGDKSWVESKERHLQKKTEDVAEQLEKSDLTEEHELPNYSGNLCYSSDGTQSGSKRKRDELPSNDNRSHGNIIRIRLPLVKHKESDAPCSNKQPCTNSGRADSYCQEFPRSDIAQLPVQEQCCSTSTQTNVVAKEFTPRSDAESLPSTSGNIESLPMDSIITGLKSKSSKKMLRKESLYKALTENWVPTPLHHEQADYDDDWLFERKHPDNHTVKILKASDDDSCRDSSSFGPRAHYLQEADIYALPYTIPF